MGDRGAGSQSGLQGGPIEIRPGASGPLQQSKRPEKLKVRNELGFADAYKKFSATGKTSLRRHQFDLAKKGNAAMLIWLGKQYLGQSDKPITEEHEEEANVDQLSNLLCSVQEIAVREQISERDAALRLADNLDTRVGCYVARVGG